MKIFPLFEDWETSRPSTLNHFDDLIREFWDKVTIYEKLNVTIRLYQAIQIKLKTDLTSQEREDLIKLRGFAHNFITSSINLPVDYLQKGEYKQLPNFLLDQIIAKQKVDPFYIPNHLPSHLSEPKLGQTPEQFRKLRLGQHLKNTRPRVDINTNNPENIIYVSSQKVVEELLPIAHQTIRERITAGHHFGDDPTKPVKRKPQSEEASASPISKHEAIRLAAERERKDYEQFLIQSTLNRATLEDRERYRAIIYDGKLIQLKNTHQGLERVPARTEHNISHEKEGWAMFVINARGEIFFNSEDNTFKHSSFMTDGPVLFAGEIKIDNGKVVGISNHSGHYVPLARHMVNALIHLEKKGLDISECKVYTHDKAELANHENTPQVLAPAFIVAVKEHTILKKEAEDFYYANRGNETAKNFLSLLNKIDYTVDINIYKDLFHKITDKNTTKEERSLVEEKITLLLNYKNRIRSLDQNAVISFKPMDKSLAIAKIEDLTEAIKQMETAKTTKKIREVEETIFAAQKLLTDINKLQEDYKLLKRTTHLNDILQLKKSLEKIYTDVKAEPDPTLRYKRMLAEVEATLEREELHYTRPRLFSFIKSKISPEDFYKRLESSKTGYEYPRLLLAVLQKQPPYNIKNSSLRSVLTPKRKMMTNHIILPHTPVYDKWLNQQQAFNQFKDKLRPFLQKNRVKLSDQDISKLFRKGIDVPLAKKIWPDLNNLTDREINFFIQGDFVKINVPSTQRKTHYGVEQYDVEPLGSTTWKLAEINVQLGQLRRLKTEVEIEAAELNTAPKFNL